MYRGRIVGMVPPDTSREVLGLMMAGVPTEEALASASRNWLRRTPLCRPVVRTCGMSPEPRSRRFVIPWSDVLITIASIVLAFLVGALLMIFSDTEVRSKFGYFFARPSDALIASWDKVSTAYAALIKGAIGVRSDYRDDCAGSSPDLRRSRRGAGLPCWAVQHRCSGPGDPGRDRSRLHRLQLASATRHSPPAGHCGRLAWRRVLGKHRRLAEGKDRCARGHRDDHDELHRGRPTGLLTHDSCLSAAGPDRPDFPIVNWNATMPRLEGSQLHLGFVLALLAAVAVWWILDRSTTGFAIRAVGANPHAAATAGMSVARTTIITMVLAGGLAGLAGVQAALGPSASGQPVPLSLGIVGSIGFDAITVALLGRSRPLGIVLAGLLFGGAACGRLGNDSVAQHRSP